MVYDSTDDTRKHIEQVRYYLTRMADDLGDRGVAHDLSKLSSPEKEAYDALTPRLAGLTYGSDEYRATLREMKPAIQHHYEANTHHPEHYPNGILGMDILDVVEMLCDWKAASLRHKDGDFRSSIEYNQTRFGFSDDLKAIFLNSLPLLEAGQE